MRSQHRLRRQTKTEGKAFPSSLTNLENSSVSKNKTSVDDMFQALNDLTSEAQKTALALGLDLDYSYFTPTVIGKI
jgi:hypothetical protein